MVVADVNQHLPTYCGSCWIHGTIAALNDRIKIARGAAFPDVMLSRQVAMNCVSSNGSYGCEGGDPVAIHDYMTKNPLPDETCQPYEAKNGVCNPSGQCRNCVPLALVDDPNRPPVHFTSPGCFSVNPGPRYGLREHASVSGEINMQKEIFARGPIVCSFVADDTFLLNFQKHLREGVYIDESYFPKDGSPSPHTEDEVDHDIEVTGWGVTKGGLPYWVVRNSWGTYWGERGWFKVLRGANHGFIESDCAWGVPDAAALEENMAKELVGSYATGRQIEPVEEDASILERIAKQQAVTASEFSVEVKPQRLDTYVFAVGCAGGIALAFAVALATQRWQTAKRGELGDGPLLGHVH